MSYSSFEGAMRTLEAHAPAMRRALRAAEPAFEQGRRELEAFVAPVPRVRIRRKQEDPVTKRLGLEHLFTE